MHRGILFLNWTLEPIKVTYLVFFMFCLFFTIWDGLVHIAACKVLREKSQIFVLKIQVGISKFQNKILGRNKRVTIFHVAWIECNCKLITEIRFCRKNNHFSTFTIINWKSFLIVTLFLDWPPTFMILY